MTKSIRLVILTQISRSERNKPIGILRSFFTALTQSDGVNFGKTGLYFGSA